MTKLALYFRLAGQNLIKNRQYQFPFFLTGAGCAAMCYLIRFLNYNKGINEMYGAVYVAQMLALGSIIMGFLMIWIMAYANGFVIRRRGRELALYNILGMQKGNVAVVLDNGPRIIQFVVNGKVCDGGTFRQFGWGRYKADLGRFELSNVLTRRLAAENPEATRGYYHLTIYNRPLLNAEVVGNHLVR